MPQSLADDAGEMIVRFRADAEPREIAKALQDAKLSVKHNVRTAGMVRRAHRGLSVVRSTMKRDKALSILRKNPAVEYAEPNYLVRALSISNDPGVNDGSLWGMYGSNSSPANSYGIDAATVWASGFTGNRSVYVAVIDDGVQITHPDLAANIWTNPVEVLDGLDNDGNGYTDDVNGWNFNAGNNVIHDPADGHGTHVAGTLGAEGGNAVGVAGVNWAVTIVPLKFMTNGVGTIASAVEAIEYCVDLKTRHSVNLVAINASWGGEGYSSALHETVINAAKAGILFICSAGNAGANNDLTNKFPANINTAFGTLGESPAGYNSVISVAAITSSGALASFSNYGAETVHIGAPGQFIYSTYPGGVYQELNGTSMAAPHVAGAVALYASTHPTASPAQIRQAILNSAIPTPSLQGKTITGGRLNISQIIPPSPEIKVVSSVLVQEGVPNGAIDPGEMVTVELTLTNAATVATTDLSAVLQESGGIFDPSGSVLFGALVAGGPAVSGQFSFIADGTCGGNVTLSLVLQNASTNLPSLSRAMLLGVGTNLFVENFDSLVVPALPNGWTTVLSGAGSAWASVNSFASSAPNAVFAPDAHADSDNALVSPVVPIHSGSARLSFRHSFIFEPGWDGAVLEISIDGGPFIDIVTAGGVFIENGYNWQLNDLTTPLTGRKAWSGDSGGFITTGVQLPASSLNKNIRLRWRCGSDSSVGGPGWFLDDISLVDGYACSIGGQSISEDHATTPFPFSLGNAHSEPNLQIAASSSDPILVPVANIAVNGTGPTRTFAVQPAADQFGSATITLKIQSDSSTTYRTFELEVFPVNDPPAFTPGSHVVAPQDVGPIEVTGWATGISPGENEDDQTLTFEVSHDNPYLFAVPPAIDESGTLTFTAASHLRGTTTVTVKLRDNGGTANAGQDQTASRQFALTIGEATDTDGDGIPDDCEAAFTLAIDDPTDAFRDRDGDGASNYQEFLAGTHPGDSSSVLRVRAAVTDTATANVVFTSVPGKTYAVEENSSFPNGSWMPVGETQVGTGGLLVRADEEAGSNVRRVYRVLTTGENGSTVASDFAGFCKLLLKGSSDTLISIPFNRPPAASGAVESINGSTITVSGSFPWTPNQFVYEAGTQTNTYHLLIRSGEMEGAYFEIVGNSVNSVTIETEGVPVDDLSISDAVAVIPYWTLGTVFPGGAGVHASVRPGDRKTEILLPDLQTAGINLSGGATYYYWDNAWRVVGEGAAIRNDDVVLPDLFLIMRHHISTDTTLTTQGKVLTSKTRTYVRRQAGAAQDNSIALCRASPVSLNDSGLFASGAFRTSISLTERIDELVVFDNSALNKNKAASATYYHWNGAWRKVGSGTADAGATLVFTPGAGVILRSGAGESAIWENLPTY